MANVGDRRLILVIAASCALFLAPTRSCDAQDRPSDFIVSNVGVTAAASAIGAVINRKAGTTLPRAFIRGLSYGAIGGTLMYEGKRVLHLIPERNTLEYAWLARIIHSSGVSISENAAGGDEAFAQFHLDLGFIRADWVRETHASRVRLLPIALMAALDYSTHHDFEAVRSLQVGALVFRERASLGEGSSAALANSIVFRPGSALGIEEERDLTHELVHSFQYEDLAAVSYWFKRPVEARIVPRAKRLARWVYPDFEYGAMRFRYELVEGGGGRHYCTNLLEREAMSIGTRSPSCTKTGR